jgi:hypothetical protein
MATTVAAPARARMAVTAIFMVRVVVCDSRVK